MCARAREAASSAAGAARRGACATRARCAERAEGVACGGLMPARRAAAGAALAALVTVLALGVAGGDADPDRTALAREVGSLERSVYEKSAGKARLDRRSSNGSSSNGSSTGVLVAAPGCRRLGYVHIPKTGGTSVVDAVKRSKLLRSLIVHFKGLNHETAVTQRNARVSPAVWDDAGTVTFATVRNPFSHTVSQYEWNYGHRCVRERSKAIAGQATADLPVCTMFVDGGHDLRASETAGERNQHFLEWLREHERLVNVSDSARRFLQPSLVAKVTKPPCRRGQPAWGAEHPAPATTQLFWITSCGEREWAVKHVVRLEDADATPLWLSRAGLEWLLCNASDAALSPALPASRSAGSGALAGAPIWRAAGRGGELSSFSATANHDNAMPHAPWVSYYTPEACEIVARRFAADFEAFGYDAGECAALVHM